MRAYLFCTLLFYSGLALKSAAQTTPVPPAKPAGPVEVTILLDGQPLFPNSTIKIGFNDVKFKALIDTTTLPSPNRFEAEAIVEEAQITLAHGGRVLAQRNWHRGESLRNFIHTTQFGDRLIFKFKVIAQRKDGAQVALKRTPMYAFPVEP